ncbi:MAG: hypothetical protein ACFB0E_09715 [Leptolyngbyaceae cyanobacterium]
MENAIFSVNEKSAISKILLWINCGKVRFPGESIWALVENSQSLSKLAKNPRVFSNFLQNTGQRKVL